MCTGYLVMRPSDVGTLTDGWFTASLRNCSKEVRRTKGLKKKKANKEVRGKASLYRTFVRKYIQSIMGFPVGDSGKESAC